MVVDVAGITATASLYALPIPLGSPLNLVLANPVVSLAWKIPVPDRRRERDSVTIEVQLPLRRTERQNDLVTTPASTEMCCGCVHHRDIEIARLEFARNKLYEDGLEAFYAAHVVALRLNM
jgi:hypothetical protein